MSGNFKLACASKGIIYGKLAMMNCPAIVATASMSTLYVVRKR